MKEIIYESRIPVDTAAPDSIAYTPHRFSVEEYFRMAEVGILGERDRVELIDGEVLIMEPPGSEHSSHVEKVADVLRASFRRRAQVRTQNPTILDRFNVPQPDISVVHWRDDYYLHAHPSGSDVFIAVEVAWSSASGDRRIKAPLYARSRIPEYWLVDLQKRRIEVYREPGESEYGSYEVIERGSSLRPISFDVEIRVDELLLL